MSVRIITGDCREKLAELLAESVHCVVTSPPYWGLRDYGVDGQIGLEMSPEDYTAAMCNTFREIRRVLRKDGTCWLNLGDSYARMQEGNVPQSKNRECLPQHMAGRIPNAGLKAKDIVGIPWRVAFALQADGWYLRQDIIWSKPNPMPESVRDRCTKAHEYIFLLSKSERYYFDQEAISEPAVYSNIAGMDGSGFKDPQSFNGKHREAKIFGARNEISGPDDGKRNRRSVWEIPTSPFPDAHFATFPPALIEPCILAGCSKGGTVLDPFGGAGTTGLVADRLGRNAILIELNPEYADMARRRVTNDCPMFADVS